MRTGRWNRSLAMAMTALMVVSTLSLIFANVTATQVPYTIGEWTVSGDETYDGGAASVTGNITVPSGAKLTLSNLTLVLEPAVVDGLTIRVEQGGSLFVHNSTIQAADPYFPYLFVFEDGSTGAITGSTIENVGSSSSNTGIEVWDSASFVIRDSKIRNSFNGIVAQGSDPTIDDCIIHDGQAYGILARDGARPLITDSVIAGFTQGTGVLIDHSDAEMRGNTIFSNKIGIEMFESMATIEENVIRDNNENGLNVENSGPTILDTEVLNSGRHGMYAKGSSITMDGNELSGNKMDGIRVTETILLMRDSVIKESGGYDIVIDGTAQTSSSYLTLMNTTFGTVDFKDPDPASLMEVYWYVLVKAVYESDGSPVPGASVYLTPSTGPITLTGQTGSEGTFGPMDVHSYTMTRSAVDSKTPYVLTVKKDKETLVEDVDISSSGADFELVFDDIPPSINLNDIVKVTKDGSIVISGMVASDTQEVRLNGEPAASLVSNYFTGTVDLEPGNNQIEVEAEDDAGNINIVVENVVRDILPPLLSLRSPVPKGDIPIYTNVGYITLEGETEAEATLWINGHKVGHSGDLFTHDVSLGLGKNLMTITAVDVAGNEVTMNLVIIYDNEAPGLTVIEPTSDHTNKEIIRLSGTIDDVDAMMTLTVNGKDIGLSPSGDTFSINVVLREGTNQLILRAMDLAGNTATVTHTILLDTIPPQLVIDSPMDGFLTSADTLMVSGMTDQDALLTVNGQGATFRSGLVFSTVVALEEGRNIIEVVARDEAGNCHIARVNVHRDSISPVIDIIEPDDGFRTAGPLVTVEGYLSEDAALTVNGHGVNLVDGYFKVTMGLQEGDNVLGFEALDNAGNLGTRSINVIRDSIVVLEIFSVKRQSKDMYSIYGMTDPDATLMIDGQVHTVEDNGFFRVVANIKDGTDFDIQVRDGMGNTEAKVVTATAPPGPPVAFDWGPAFMWASFMSAMLVVGLVGGTERGRLFALFFLFVPLYSKMKKNTVLDHYTRGQIHGYIVANPGDHYNSIKESLKLNNGTLAYHLRVLEKEGIVKSRADGIYKRFYPMGMKVPESSGTRLTEIQKIIIKRIKETPGISQKEMARLVGVSPSTINYHFGILKSAGLVRSERRGMRVGYFLERLEDLPRPVEGSEDMGGPGGPVRNKVKVVSVGDKAIDLDAPGRKRRRRKAS